ncbi:hypothetical protein [Clavibacter michiganensis]|uniref:hypothetical protein n=1 Tax=Clavibacter michiganensis TaxID=28447 RepID=UPI0011B03136|nr:hypothetical protein [Clavibacter michiganensis]
MPSPSSPRQVERRIYFYRIDAGTDSSGAPILLDLRPTIERASNIPFAEDSPRYWTQRDGDAIALWPHPSGASFGEFSLAAIRRTSLPQSELLGNLTNLQLMRGAGLHEPIHFKLFDNNIVGVEFNFYAPRPSRLAQYLQHALSDAPDFTLQPLLRQNVAAQLGKHGELRVLKLFIRRSYAAELSSSSDSLSSAFASIKALSNAKVLGLTLKPEPNQRTPLGKKILKGVKSLAARSELSENVVTFQTRGVNSETGKVETLDLLQDKLIFNRRIVTLGENTRAVDPHATFAAIQEAYQESRALVESAPGIGDVQEPAVDD